MAKPQQVLILAPSSELIFKGPFTECVNAYITLKNPSPRDVYFKVKISGTRQAYHVRPNSGIIMANNKTQINVMLQPVETPEALEYEREQRKFMIQTAFAPEGKRATAKAFLEMVEPSMVMDSKLRVAFRGPFVFVNGGCGPSNTFMSTKEYPIASDSRAKGPLHDPNEPQFALEKEIELRKMYQDEKTILEKENYALRKVNERLSGAGVGSIQQDNVQPNPLHFVLFFFIIAAIGYILGKLK